MKRMLQQTLAPTPTPPTPAVLYSYDQILPTINLISQLVDIYWIFRVIALKCEGVK